MDGHKKSRKGRTAGDLPSTWRSSCNTKSCSTGQTTGWLRACRSGLKERTVWTVKACYKSPDQGKKADEDNFSSSKKFLKMTETGYCGTFSPLWHLLEGQHSMIQNLRGFWKISGKNSTKWVNLHLILSCNCFQGKKNPKNLLGMGSTAALTAVTMKHWSLKSCEEEDKSSTDPALHVGRLTYPVAGILWDPVLKSKRG